jgi:hypothetical protein
MLARATGTVFLWFRLVGPRADRNWMDRQRFASAPADQTVA